MGLGVFYHLGRSLPAVTSWNGWGEPFAGRWRGSQTLLPPPPGEQRAGPG